MSAGVIRAGGLILLSGILGFALTRAPSAILGGGVVGALLMLLGWLSRQHAWAFTAAMALSLLGTFGFGWRLVLALIKALTAGPSVTLLLLGFMTVVSMVLFISLARNAARTRVVDPRGGMAP